MILAGLAYRDVGQPRFFSFFRKSRDCRFRLHKGRKPRLSLRSRDNSVREPNAQPALATGLFTGFGVRPQRAKMDFQRSRWKSILSICGNKCTARQVAHLRKIPYRYIFAPSLVSGGILSETRNWFTASILHEYISHRIMQYVLWRMVFFITSPAFRNSSMLMIGGSVKPTDNATMCSLVTP